MKFSTCIPDLDEAHWAVLDLPNVNTVEDAAEAYAQQKCGEDCDLYRMFEEAPGVLVLVKMVGQSAKAVRVLAEREWVFNGWAV